MPGTWDDLMKMLIRANPQDFLSFIFEGAHYQEDITHEQKVRSVITDFLCKAELDGKAIIVHIEFQRRHDKTMGRRMWEYNSSVAFLTRLPVYSFVIYLREDDYIVEPPYQLKGVRGEVLQVLNYRNILLWEVPAEELQQAGLEGLLPLLPLTKGAEIARDDIVDTMIGALQARDQGDLLALGYAFASLVYDTRADKQWLRRRFAMFESTLEDSWFYQEIIQKGIARGIEKGIEQGIEKGVEQGIEQGIGQGIEQGIEQGELKTLRSILIRFVETHFSELQVLAQQLAEQTMASSLLEKTVNDLLAAQTIEQARLILTEANEKIDKPS